MNETASILLVDDRRENLIALQAILGSRGYRLVTARSGRQALTRILEEDFALVVLDVFMPGMDGFEVAQLLQQRERSRDTFIIFLTAMGTEIRFAQRGYSLGAVDYLTKPIDADLLRTKVAVFVELFKRREQVKEQAELLRQNERRDQELALANQRLASEKRYQFLTNALPQIVWTASAEGLVDYCNQRWTQFTGMTLEQLGNKGWLAAVHPDDLQRCQDGWREAVRGTSPYQVECRLRHADGSYRWHLCRALPEFDVSGTVSAWLGTHTDIADQKERQEEAVAAEKRSMLLVQASEELARSFDYREALRKVERILVPALADWCEILELEPSESRELQVHPDPALEDWAPTPIGPPHPELFRAMQAVSYLIVPLVLRDGVIGEIRLAFTTSGRRFRSEERETIESLARHVAFTVENAKLFDEAQRAVAMRDEVLAVVSHDLKNPLSAINLTCDAMLGAEKRGQKISPVSLHRIKRSGDLMERLIADLLDMAGLQAGNLSVERARQPVAGIVHDAMEALQPLASERNNRLQTELEDESLAVYCDRHRILQVLTNLVGNAVKFTPEGGVIKIRAQSRGSEVCLAVVDTGPGISDDQLPHVFEPYWKGREIQKGTGLGLYIAKGIVERHGGKILGGEPGGSRHLLLLYAPHSARAGHEALPAAGDEDRLESCLDSGVFVGVGVGVCLGGIEFFKLVIALTECPLASTSSCVGPRFRFRSTSPSYRRRGE